MSQQQLADLSTLSVRAIRDIENGRVRRPRQDTCELLLRVLDIGRPDGCAAQETPVRIPVRGHWADGPFVGRHDELEALADLFDSEHQLVVTVTGIEGVGKTRLCVEFVRRMQQREELLVVWMQGGSAALDARPLAAIARDLVSAGESGVMQLRDAIAGRRALIVFDGEWPQEQLMPTIDSLLAVIPQVRILITARRPIGFAAESLLPLAALPVPAVDRDHDPAVLEQVASVQLFLAHLKPLDPAFRLDTSNAAVVAQICHAVDGIPALLASAARSSLLYLPQHVADLVSVDPLVLLSRTDGARPLLESVHEAVAQLPGHRRELLSLMADRGLAWSVPEASATTGTDARRCADDIFALYMLGLLRRRSDGDLALFECLNTVKAVIRRDGAPDGKAGTTCD
ncbi:helix-turn-helix domain-containing protein [Catellatospora sp. NEAU-YM18]|nr:helix-turn-helix domain-containing protein [Catellatospora tritici]